MQRITEKSVSTSIAFETVGLRTGTQKWGAYFILLCHVIKTEFDVSNIDLWINLLLPQSQL